MENTQENSGFPAPELSSTTQKDTKPASDHMGEASESHPGIPVSGATGQRGSCSYSILHWLRTETEQKLFAGIQTPVTLSKEINVYWFKHRTCQDFSDPETSLSNVLQHLEKLGIYLRYKHLWYFSKYFIIFTLLQKRYWVYVEMKEWAYWPVPKKRNVKIPVWLLLGSKKKKYHNLSASSSPRGALHCLQHSKSVGRDVTNH